jgi:hypothetical protein
MPAEDLSGYSGAVAGPYVDGATVTPSDTVNFAKVCNALYIATAQTALTVVTQKGTVLALVSAPAGTLLPIRCSRVNATGTTPGTGIVALF